MQPQVEKVLSSWRKEKIFPDAIVEQCASNVGIALGSDAAAPAIDAADANAVNVASPVLSIFSEPSAGSVDLEALDAYPPKTVASANTEAVRYTVF